MKPSKHLIFALFALAISQPTLAAPQPLDRVAVQINDGIVLESEIVSMIGTVKPMPKRQINRYLLIVHCVLRLLNA